MPHQKLKEYACLCDNEPRGEADFFSLSLSLPSEASTFFPLLSSSLSRRGAQIAQEED